VLLGQGDGTVSKAVNYAAGSNPHSVVVGDFNADGKPDLAVANFGSGNVSVLLGQGDGTLQATLSLSMGGGAESVVAADFNDDGESDLVVAHIYSNFVTVLLNSGAPAGLGLSCVRRSNILSVSWALQSVGFVLESTTSLSLTNWQPAVEGQTTNNGRLEVSAPLDQPQRFFRLRAP